MSTRSKRKSEPLESKDVLTKKRIENSWILLAKEDLLKNDNFNIITLPHPAHGGPSKYCLDKANLKIYEILTFKEDYRSWFINESVKSDGSLMIVTPINPLFLVLPKLRQQCCDRAVPLEDLLAEKGFDKLINFFNDLNTIGDLKGSADLKAYKYNEEKTLMWLEQKIRKLSQILRDRNIHVTSGAISATFVASTVNSDKVDDDFYLKYAHGIVSEYLEDHLIKLLEERFNIKSDLIEQVGNKRKSEMGESNEIMKKIKFEAADENENKPIVNNVVPDVKKPKQLTSKEKARQKAASGSKAISSFFSKT
ncbi:ribonuclease H2 subunit B [Danaus plexippus]|uniref:ribonuclease H2 subunit B n=1 Tax=Danaus plexippus TaxID=13037 RepID=UPI002AB24707|nr:ribonuclease H2 subunit B [Danaus plexippus]